MYINQKHTTFLLLAFYFVASSLITIIYANSERDLIKKLDEISHLVLGYVACSTNNSIEATNALLELFDEHTTFAMTFPQEALEEIANRLEKRIKTFFTILVALPDALREYYLKRLCTLLDVLIDALPLEQRNAHTLTNIKTEMVEQRVRESIEVLDKNHIIKNLQVLSKPKKKLLDFFFKQKNDIVAKSICPQINVRYGDMCFLQGSTIDLLMNYHGDRMLIGNISEEAKTVTLHESARRTPYLYLMRIVQYRGTLPPFLIVYNPFWGFFRFDLLNGEPYPLAINLRAHGFTFSEDNVLCIAIRENAAGEYHIELYRTEEFSELPANSVPKPIGILQIALDFHPHDICILDNILAVTSTHHQVTHSIIAFYVIDSTTNTIDYLNTITLDHTTGQSQFLKRRRMLVSYGHRNGKSAIVFAEGGAGWTQRQILEAPGTITSICTNASETHMIGAGFVLKHHYYGVSHVFVVISPWNAFKKEWDPFQIIDLPDEGAFDRIQLAVSDDGSRIAMVREQHVTIIPFDDTTS